VTAMLIFIFLGMDILVATVAICLILLVILGDE
jgi:hypothetical protein